MMWRLRAFIKRHVEEPYLHGMTCERCGTTENVGEDGLCGDCAQDEDDFLLDDDECDREDEDC